MSGKNENLIVGLDVGTTKICVIVGNENDGVMEIIGVGTSPSRGLRKGVVVNIDQTVSAIKKAVEEAELMAGCEIKSVYVGIAGGHIKSLNSRGIVAVKSKEVTHDDIRRVMDAAKAINIPADREIIHLIPQDFSIDNQEGIREPLGMSGVRLEAEVHIVTAAVTSAENIVKSCNRAGLDVADVVLEQIASSEAVLTEDEKELGVVLIDIGGGTTDIAVFQNGAIRFTSTLPLGGAHLTNDVAVGLRTPAGEAEKIKQLAGCCLTTLVGHDETVTVPGVGGRKPRTIPRAELASILEVRVEEMFSLVKDELKKFNCLDQLPSGVVLTGGTTILPGMPELAEQVFELPIRRGVPRNMGGLADHVASPTFSTGVGLVFFGNKNAAGPLEKQRAMAGDGLFSKLIKKMAGWFDQIL